MKHLKVSDLTSWTKPRIKDCKPRSRQKFNVALTNFEGAVKKSKLIKSLTENDIKAYKTFLRKTMKQSKSTAAMYMNYLRSALVKTKLVKDAVIKEMSKLSKELYG